MSYLHRSLLKNRDTRLPHRAPVKDYSPLTWDKYFEESRDVTVNSSSFRVYLSGTEGPILVLLHGGGYSGLTWSLFTREITAKIQCKILAIDLRGHGETHTKDDENLSIESMTEDVISVVNTLGKNDEPLVVIGHSMGGALAVYCAHNLPNCIGLCVIDVVEGTAMESLASMQTFLRNRPQNFVNVEHAIQWCYRSGQTHNLESARVSMPGQIKNFTTGKLAATEVSEVLKTGRVDADSNLDQPKVPVPGKLSETEVLDHVDSTLVDEQVKHSLGIAPISEESSETDENHIVGRMEPPSSYTWRINLSKTEVHWRGWFQGLSELFLGASVPKLLLLANIHGLDTSLTVGQMQGKFQMQVLPRCGHAIHEDLPDKVADIIATYLVRQKLTVALSDFTPTFPAC